MAVPRHVAIILDGNGRWAKAKGMPRTYGHIKGCENLEKICSIAKELGVKYLTVYAFFYRKLEAFQRRSRRTYEIVSQLHETVYSNFKGKPNVCTCHW